MSYVPILQLIDECVKPVKVDNIPADGTPYVVKSGVLVIGGVELSVHVLNTGQRIIKKESLEKFIGDCQ